MTCPRCKGMGRVPKTWFFFRFSGKCPRCDGLCRLAEPRPPFRPVSSLRLGHDLDPRFPRKTEPSCPDSHEDDIDDALIVAMAVADGVIEPKGREDAPPVAADESKLETGGGSFGGAGASSSWEDLHPGTPAPSYDDHSDHNSGGHDAGHDDDSFDD
jgi:hypothetical protein